MKSLIVTQQIIKEIYDDESFKHEAADFINSLIDEELLKETPDCDFIDECISALESLEQDDFSNVIPFIKDNAAVRKDKHKLFSILVACALITAASLGVAAVNHTIEKREKENTTTSAVSNQISEIQPQSKKSETQKTQTTKTTATTQKIVTQKLTLTFGKSFKDEYLIGEKLDTSGISVTAENSDGSKQNVPLSECEIIYDDDFGRYERYETVTVVYKNVSASFKVRVLRGKDTKVLNSVYAAFPEGFNFKTDDINNIDLSGIQVFAVYSDKTETKLTDGEYQLETEILPDGKTAMITIRYKSVYTTFGIREEQQ